MRDIGVRIQKYRLSRYASPQSVFRRRLRWVWIVAAIWLAWAGLLSEHSYYRIWRLDREKAGAARELERVRSEIARLDAELQDPEAGRMRAERWLRERDGMARPKEIVYRIRSGIPDSLSR